MINQNNTRKMKKSLQSLVLLLMTLMVPVTATAAYDQLADGVYMDGTTLYITSGVTSLGDLQVDPSEIYCYATIPPACASNTFTSYGATLHVPAAGMVSYFTALYWYNFNNILSDAIEPQSVTMNANDTEVGIGQQLSLSATVAPGNATPMTVYWSSTDPSVAIVSDDGTVTAVAAGECDILATCVDKVAVCHVNVVPPRVTITLDKHEARLLPNHTLTLTATCTPMDVGLAVTSSSPGVAIPRLVNGTIMVVGVAEGTATITVNAADGWGNPDECEVTVYTELGDANCDGYLNIADVTELIDYLLNGDASQINLTNSDTDKNGSVNIADVTEMIDYLLNGYWSWEEPITYTVNGVSFKMVPVEGGTFMMGACDEDTDVLDSERPAHKVSLSNFQIGETEVSQALWQAVMGSNPSNFSGNPNRPVERVSWYNCQVFIAKLNQLTGMNFRLPTEAEWEFAACGGTKSKGYKYAGSNVINDVAWYKVNASDMGSTSLDYGPHSVGTKQANELGIYDMSGNVWEWCQDWYGDYSGESQINPIGPVSGTYRVARGGGWFNEAWECRVSRRTSSVPNHMEIADGLRLALDPDNSSKFRLSNTVVTVLVGESKTVEILNGNGIYTIACGTDYTSSTISGNSLTVTGTNEGTTTIYVTDTSTGATTVLTVIVEKPEIQDETFTVKGVTFKMIAVEGGSFMMGATSEQGSDAFDNERPVHEVTLSSYSIGETEVTQALWLEVMGSNPSHFTGNLKRPVEKISWNDCQVFIAKLNELTGRNFRLPTEAEWEFAARGGNCSQGFKYSGSNNFDDVAWYNGNSSLSTHQVATKFPNELGLYDMSGNVCEWCQDLFGSYGSDAETNPVGPVSGTSRVLRGGCWDFYTKYCRVSWRYSENQYPSNYHYGLRLALDPDISPEPSDHEYVDLGLPSGTLWASCNVGANSPEEYGDYFAWGETEPKEVYNWSTYKWCNGSSNNTLTKYCTNSSYGTVDNKAELEPEDDAAYVNWGPSWRMPTYDQINELKTKCTWTWTTQNGVNGRLVTGPNGNTLFLPAAGCRYDDSLYYAGSSGGCWSRTLIPGHPYRAYGMYFGSADIVLNDGNRYSGFTVRAVRVKQN